MGLPAGRAHQFTWLTLATSCLRTARLRNKHALQRCEGPMCTPSTTRAQRWRTEGLHQWRAQKQAGMNLQKPCSAHWHVPATAHAKTAVAQARVSVSDWRSPARKPATHRCSASRLRLTASGCAEASSSRSTDREGWLPFCATHLGACLSRRRTWLLGQPQLQLTPMCAAPRPIILAYLNNAGAKPYITAKAERVQRQTQGESLAHAARPKTFRPAASTASWEHY